MTAGDWDIKLLYDGACPLCSREARFLRRRDQHGRLAFEDIADDDHDPSRYGLTDEQVMARMHGILPDGSVVSGMEVFRRAYRAIGMGWLLAPTGWPGLRLIFDWLYQRFANNRAAIARCVERCVR